MSISARSEYACRALVELSRTYPSREVKQLKDIAAAQDIPDKYLVHILLQLKKHGLIGSVRGANGGYFLRQAPSKISLGDVIRIVDGPLLPLKCLPAKAVNQCNREKNCDLKDIWKDVSNEITKVVDNISFSQILERIQNRVNDGYQI